MVVAVSRLPAFNSRLAITGTSPPTGINAAVPSRLTINGSPPHSSESRPRTSFAAMPCGRAVVPMVVMLAERNSGTTCQAIKTKMPKTARITPRPPARMNQVMARSINKVMREVAKRAARGGRVVGECMQSPDLLENVHRSPTDGETITCSTVPASLWQSLLAGGNNHL